jgi:CheY-like chemotaxis protein
LTRLVDDLLDVSRITSGKIELRWGPVALGPIVAAAVEAASPSVAAGSHTLRLDVPEEPIYVDADSVRIAQAITNLLNNSAKYTPEGGSIALEVRREAADTVILVRDSGRGIPADELPGVFDMFRQLHRTDRCQGGPGIGLALVKRIVEMHGGSIEARSGGVGAGAEFVMRLPNCHSAGVNRTGPAEPTPAGRRRLHVLIVDDNGDLAEMLALVVETAGHTVRTVVDGPSAVAAALSYRPNVVLLDIGLPGMRGIEVAKELRQHPETAATRLVALTGWGQADDRRETADAGFDHHLTKPADPQQVEELLEVIAESATRL